jgi:hypothetical protein
VNVYPFIEAEKAQQRNVTQRKGWPATRPKISAAHGHPEPADMRPDDGAFGRPPAGTRIGHYERVQPMLVEPAR